MEMSQAPYGMHPLRSPRAPILHVATQKKESSFYNKSLVNLMRLDASSFEEPEDAYFTETIGFDDMVHMKSMEEDSVLQNLKERYNNKIIYTYTGGMLVALNPFQPLNIYGKARVEHFANNIDFTTPHIFGVAEKAYSNMKECTKDQSILICGESGSGKTESTKLILQYLVDRITTKSECSIETKMLESIPILEALGNAKTTNNDNSSRFGKFIQVEFNKHYAISGSKIKAYLLEKSRVTHQPPGERNFHIFYQITEGASNDFRKRFYMKNAKYYRYLSSTTIQLPGVNEAEGFKHFNSALRMFNLPDAMVESLFCILSAILYLGNIDFTDSVPVELAQTEKAKEALLRSGELLGIDPDELFFSITHNRLCMKLETIEKPLTREQAIATTNTFAKCLYHRLFHWLVDLINETTYGGTATKNYIGILDIFGFENFERNSYEQFLINYANEKFQQLQNHYIFDVEQREYQAEGIEWKRINSQDNQQILNLIETPPLSILSLLREGSRFPNSSDNLLGKLHKQFKNSAVYEVPALNADSQFILHHYPGKVTYTVDSWVDKDHDNLPSHINEVIESRCSNKLISLMFSVNQSSNTTISGQFKFQLKELMNTIHLTNPLFIRCVKPNSQKLLDTFHDDLTLAQLRCTGMLNCIQIRKLGYPVRLKFDEFISRYSLLIDGSKHSALMKNPKKSCKKMLDKLKKRYIHNTRADVVIGRTKVLMKESVSLLLDEMRGNILCTYVMTIKRWWKMIRARMYLSAMKNSVLLLQRSWRMLCYQRAFKQQKKSTLLLQSVVRRFLASKQRDRLNNEIERVKRLAYETVIVDDSPIEENPNIENPPSTKEFVHTEKEMVHENSQETKIIEVKMEEPEPERITTKTSSIEERKKRRKSTGKHSNISNNAKDSIIRNESAVSPRKKRKSKRKIKLEIDQIQSSTTSISKEKKHKGSESKRKSGIERTHSFKGKNNVKKKRKSGLKKLRYEFQGGPGGSSDLPLGTKEILIGTNWSLTESIDIDSCCLFYEYETFIDVVWQFNNISKDRSSQFLGFPKWLPKNQQIDREQIHVDLTKLPNTISTIFIALIIFSPGMSWKSVEKSSVRIMCSSTQGVDAVWAEWGSLQTFPNQFNDENSAKIFCKLTRNGFTWTMAPLDVIVPARTYKAVLPHLDPMLDIRPPMRTINVGVHRAENLLNHHRKNYVTKYYVAIHFGEEKVVTGPAFTHSPAWNSLHSITAVGTILSICIYRKKSPLFRIERKLVGSVNIALSRDSLEVQENWFYLPEGRILLSVFEK